MDPRKKTGCDFRRPILSLGILAHLLRMVMEPKYLAFWRWLYTPIIIWRSVIGSLGYEPEDWHSWCWNFMFCLKVQQSSGPRNLQGLLGLLVGPRRIHQWNKVSLILAPLQKWPKLNWVSLASEQVAPNGRFAGLYDLMSTLTFFGGFLPPPDLSRNQKKQTDQTWGLTTRW